ncbi:helix-turn-helix domain-containing protein [Neolewinella xylanilytica]|nr:helix-turn-helix transcriptional regulator [Neolewinella xylanilytica]
MENVMNPNCGEVRYSRRDFFKITLIRGHNCYHYADKSLEIDGPTLIFFNPRVPYTWEGLSEDVNGYFIIFQEAFVSGRFVPALSELSMFQPGGSPAYRLNDAQEKEVTDLFEKMLREVDSDYPHKYDLLRNYAAEMIHYALKLQPSEKLYENVDASGRLTGVFLELLERQFPIDSQQQRFTLRSAGDYAERLAVHVNHLNRSVKETTGKTTTTLIANRVAAEARALLKHTDWNISEVGDSLGFREPAHFANFFKRHTGQSPTAYRSV